MSVRHDYLEVRDLTVDFDGFKAVNGVDLTVSQGDLHFLIGPNGAGKTTLVDALTGLVPATGSIRFGGVDLLGDEVAPDRARSGSVGRSRPPGVRAAHRAAEPRHRRGRRIARPLGHAAPAARVPDARRGRRWRPIGLTALAHRPAGVLAHGQKQWLEVGMLLVQDAQVMLLDETVAGMSAGRARGDRRAAAADRRASAPSSSSSTTWSSCAASPTS